MHWLVLGSAVHQPLHKDCGREAQSGERVASFPAAHHLICLEVWLNSVLCCKPIMKGDVRVFKGEKKVGGLSAASQNTMN